VDEYVQGATAPLLTRFYAYPGGPLVNVPGVEIEVAPVGGGGSVIGPTSTGVVNESTGLYSYLFEVPEDLAAGLYLALWEGSDGTQAAETFRIVAGASGWAPDYITVARLKRFLRIDPDDTDDDEDLADDVSTACRSVDDFCNRQFGLIEAPEERRYTARPDYERGLWVVDIDDLMTETGLTVTVAGSAVTGYELEPATAAQRGRPWTVLVLPTGTGSAVPNEAVLVGRWGWSAVPARVRKASLLQASRLAVRRDSPYGIAGSPEVGSEMRLLAKLDPDVAVSLRGLARRRAVR
jgi:hypothetical protein